jgi:tRNA 2-selenouridine synthase
MAWLFQTAQLHTLTLEGGYKAFRRWALAQLTIPYRLRVLGGFTGSRKTTLLSELSQAGEQVIDLEKLSHHRGSAFGALGLSPQPSSEFFENQIALALHGMDADRVIWVEDESRMIGACKIPDVFFNQMQKSPLYFIDRERQERVETLIHAYGDYPKEMLIACVHKMSKRLGGALTYEICEKIRAGNLSSASHLLLNYYDSAYLHSIERSHRSPIKIDGSQPIGDITASLRQVR